MVEASCFTSQLHIYVDVFYMCPCHRFEHSVSLFAVLEQMKQKTNKHCSEYKCQRFVKAVA